MKCPKCNSDELEDNGIVIVYKCQSYSWSEGDEFSQSDECRIRELESVGLPKNLRLLPER